MKFEMFSEAILKEDIPEYELLQGSSAIIVDYCPRPEGQEDGYVLEVLDEQENGFEVIAVPASQIKPITRESVSV